MRAGRVPLDFLTERPFAHRGLHGPGVPENSLAAARAAIAIGQGMECDVRLGGDGMAYAYHDRYLERLTDGKGSFGALSAAKIAALRLNGSDEPIPTLAALLDLVRPPIPLLIELKSDAGPAACARLCTAVAAALEPQPGARAVMSFDPLVCHWFARHRPDVVRGLVIGRRHRTGIVARRGTRLAIARAMPHFIACDVRDLPQAATHGRRRPLLCWTVRSARDAARAAAHADQIIHEKAG